MSFNLTERIRILNAISNLDEHYGPYENRDVVIASVPIELREVGRTVGILDEGTENITEYWWKEGIDDEQLINKTKSQMGLIFSIADDGDLENGFQVPLSEVSNLAFSGQDFEHNVDLINRVLLIKARQKTGHFPEYIALSINEAEGTWQNELDETNPLTPRSAYVILQGNSIYRRYVTDGNNDIYDLGIGYTAAQIDDLFQDVNTSITNINNILTSDDLNLDQLQEIVNYIKDSQQQIQDIIDFHNTGINESGVGLIDDYSIYNLGLLTTQQQFNNAVGTALVELTRKANARYTTSISESGIVEHNLNTYDVEVFFYDLATRYNASGRVWRPTPNSVEILFDTEPENPIKIIVKEI